MISHEEAEILAAEIERLTIENIDLKEQVDFLMRERMDAKSLEEEARKARAAKVLMTVREQALAAAAEAAQRGDE